jgi:hypothetical protein
MLEKFYRGNNITIGVTFANENLTFVVTQTGTPRARRPGNKGQGGPMA